ncbi:hypothetical protein FMUAM8_26840 [Nocardia cyriacigeorgica]|nr:hypothetical protein FMUAM8_26840 [Nocardia cyriacigeorgica]
MRRELEPRAFVWGVVSHHMDRVRSAADRAGALASCRIIKMTEAGGYTLEQITVLGMPASEGRRGRLVACESGGKFHRLLDSRVSLDRRTHRTATEPVPWPYYS